MKRIFIGTSISFILIFVIIVSFFLIPHPTNNDFFTKSVSQQDKNSLKDLLLKNSVDIANVLMKNAVPDNVSGLKWNKYFNYTGSNPDSHFYYGYGYGAAGIGDFFIDLYNKTQNMTFLDIAIEVYNYIFAHVITNGTLYSNFVSQPGYIFWTRSEDSQIPYPGFKYGNAGITDFLLNLYLNTNNNTYLALAERSLSIFYLTAIDAKTVSPAMNGIYWGYSLIDPTPIADIIYGNVGIADAFLNTYEITKNASYLNIASQSLAWLLSESAVTFNTSSGQRFFRYSPDPTYPYNFTGYLAGASGIGQMYLNYFTVTNNQGYLMVAQQIGNWLIANDKNGLWPNGGSNLLTNSEYSNEDGYFTGYGAGSAGIGLFLLNLYNSTHDSKYLVPVKQIVSMFMKNGKIQSSEYTIPVQIGPTNQNIIETDLKMGISGVGLFFSSLYSFFGSDEELNFIQGITNYLVSLKDSNGIIPRYVGSNISASRNFDLSYLEGLTGIGVFYLNAFSSLNSSSVFNSSVYNNISVPSTSGFIDFSLIFILIPAILRKGKKNNY